MMSTAALACESRRRSWIADRAANHSRSRRRSSENPAPCLFGEGGKKFPDPRLDRLRRVGAEHGGTGQQRRGDVHQPAALPVPRECGAHRWSFAAVVEPGAHGFGGPEQR
jgi:hypothetical protein